MGSPPNCEHCGKKFKVFAKRRKCTHCQTTLCRVCFNPHVAARHPNVGSTAGGGSSSNLTDGSWADDDDDIHFQSPLNASDGANDSGIGSAFGSASFASKKSARAKIESAVDLLDDLEDVEAVEVEENEDDDEEDGNDEDLLLGDYSRRASMEEEENQFREFTQLQHAVEKWTRKEIEVKKQLRLAKHNSSIYARKPVPDFGSTREYQQRELFTASYAVFVTVVVWAIFAVSMGIYIRLIERTLEA